MDGSFDSRKSRKKGKKMADHVAGGVLKAVGKVPVLIPLGGAGFLFFQFGEHAMSICGAFLVALTAFNVAAVVIPPHHTTSVGVVLILAGGAVANSIILAHCSSNSPLWYAALITLLVCSPWFLLTSIVGKASEWYDNKRRREENDLFVGEYLIPLDMVVKFREANGGVFPRRAVDMAFRDFDQRHPEFYLDVDLRRRWVDRAQEVLTNYQIPQAE
jgi:hypothetical protein